MEKAGKLWELGAGALNPKVEAFLSSLAVDKRFMEVDLEGSAAHASMLGKTGIIKRDMADSLVYAILEMLEEARAGKLEVDDGCEDIHSFVEQELTRRLGAAGRAVHSGRSRNDQVALDMRLYLRKAFSDAQHGILVIIDSLCDLAAKHTESIMPSYTHLRRAQPSTLAFHLLAWCAALERDYGRFKDASIRANECPLGSAAVAGSGLPLDREAVALSLGFARPSRNAMDATADRDACTEYAAAASIFMMHLSRYCEELILWSSSEFDFMEIADDCSTGSSIMPQKRNPDVAELARGKSGRVFGALMELLTIQKGLPLAYNRDLQADKEAVFGIHDTLKSLFPAFAALVEDLKPKTANMAKALESGFAEATDLAELLTGLGLPFRDSYAAVKKAVAIADSKKLRLKELNNADLAEASPFFEEFGIDAAKLGTWLEPQACVSRRNHVGGPAPERVKEEIDRLKAFVKACRMEYIVPGRLL